MTKKTKIKLIIISIASVAFILAGLFTAKTLLSKNDLKNTVYQVKNEVYENCIEIAGTVKAAEEQTLQALGAGTVIDVYVEKGDFVKKGDLIIQLDSTEQEYNLAKLDYDMASSRITGSKKELQLQEKQRLSLLRKIEDRKVIATFDGIIADLDVAPGDSLEAKDSVGTLVNIDYLTAEVEIAETDVSKLKVGQQVDFTFPSYDGTIYGYVTGWPAIGEVTSRGATIVKATIRIDDFPETILPNFSFTGKIQITQPVENIVVEKYAIAYENHEPYVETVTGKRIDVQVQPYGRTYVKILDGLSGGEILKAQSKPQESGFNRMRGPGGMGGMGGMPKGGMPKGGMGAGGPPPMGF